MEVYKSWWLRTNRSPRTPRLFVLHVIREIEGFLHRVSAPQDWNWMKIVAQHLFVLFVIKRTVLDLFSAETRNTFLVHHLVFFPSTGLSIYHLSQANQGRPCTITHRIYLRLCDSNLTPISPQLMSSYNHFSQQKDCLSTTYALRGFSFPLSTTVSFWCCYFFYRL